LLGFLWGLLDSGGIIRRLDWSLVSGVLVSCGDWKTGSEPSGFYLFEFFTSFLPLLL